MTVDLQQRCGAVPLVSVTLTLTYKELADVANVLNSGSVNCRIVAEQFAKDKQVEDGVVRHLKERYETKTTEPAKDEDLPFEPDAPVKRGRKPSVPVKEEAPVVTETKVVEEPKKAAEAPKKLEAPVNTSGAALEFRGVANGFVQQATDAQTAAIGGVFDAAHKKNGTKKLGDLTDETLVGFKNHLAAAMADRIESETDSSVKEMLEKMAVKLNLPETESL